ncbi:MAG TPA: cbb3-type cytochrome c oxidase subunit 3 [Reyranella sp.]|nr:cbb3-type cytochrome c oxidase subunit 3 [Reyranella sp.]
MSIDSLGDLLATVWTVWAVTICLGIAWWALRPANRSRFESDARIPLNDER